MDKQSALQVVQDMKNINLNSGTGDFKTGWEMAIEEAEFRIAALAAAPATEPDNEGSRLHKAMLKAQEIVNNQPGWMRAVSPIIRPPKDEPTTAG